MKSSLRAWMLEISGFMTQSSLARMERSGIPDQCSALFCSDLHFSPEANQEQCPNNEAEDKTNDMP